MGLQTAVPFGTVTYFYFFFANMSLLLAEHPELWYLDALLADANGTLAAALRGSGQDELADQAERQARRHRQELRPAAAPRTP